MTTNALQKFFEKYIEGTTEKAYVTVDSLMLCNVTKKVAEALNFHKRLHVSISTRALKHLYDKKPAEEFSCLLRFMDKIIRYPLRIYKNKDNKKGNYCFFGVCKGEEYICSIQIVENEGQVVTCFRNRNEKYLKEYILLWSREADAPPS